jgi:hypothetical protein
VATASYLILEAYKVRYINLDGNEDGIESE